MIVTVSKLIGTKTQLVMYSRQLYDIFKLFGYETNSFQNIGDVVNPPFLNGQHLWGLNIEQEVIKTYEYVNNKSSPWISTLIIRPMASTNCWQHHKYCLFNKMQFLPVLGRPCHLWNRAGDEGTAWSACPGRYRSEMVYQEMLNEK